MSSLDNLSVNINKLLTTDTFKASISDFKTVNEVLVNTAVEKLNTDLELLIKENFGSINDKISLFDKNFIDTLVDKFEEIRLIASRYDDSFGALKNSISDSISAFDIAKKEINTKFENLVKDIKDSDNITQKCLQSLNESFENLRLQISNRVFDDAFQASINNQLASLENLVAEQLGYIEDINELCTNNLPDVTELNTLVKHSILESIKNFSEKLDSRDINEQLNQMKSDIITQLINVFNQVSFVAEQEEIVDFIQEKHNDLITILSHIVTDTSGIETINNNLVVIDDKINNLKNDIYNINEKISAIISSEALVGLKEVTHLPVL